MLHLFTRGHDFGATVLNVLGICPTIQSLNLVFDLYLVILRLDWLTCIFKKNMYSCISTFNTGIAVYMFSICEANNTSFLFEVQMTGGACPPTCHCKPLQDWRNQNISLIALEEVAIENVRGRGHEVDFVKLVFRCAPLMKRMSVKLAPKVLPSNRGCKEIYDIFKANPSVTCYLYSSCGEQVVHA